MKPSGIGGQAVLEGVMMRNKDKYAVAVRKADKDIVVDVQNCKNADDRAKILKLPFIRGAVNFVDSLVIGIKTLTYSAEFYEDEEEVVEKPVDKVTRSIFKEKAESFLMGLTVFISICFSVFLFIVLPYTISELLKNQMNIISNSILAVVEGVVRIIIFVLYLLLISRMKDIQRTFMYHGAEHKCINCIESGFDLTVENAKISSRIHKRCGTSFLFFVVFVSIVCFILVSTLLPEDITIPMKVGIRLLLVPVIAGISYEILRLAGRSDSLIMRIISMPGMLMQRLTTKEPDDDMIEVAIEAVEAVFDWKKFIEDNKEDFGLIGNTESTKDEDDKKTDDKESDIKEDNEVSDDVELDDNKSYNNASEKIDLDNKKLDNTKTNNKKSKNKKSNAKSKDMQDVAVSEDKKDVSKSEQKANNKDKIDTKNSVTDNKKDTANNNNNKATRNDKSSKKNKKTYSDKSNNGINHKKNKENENIRSFDRIEVDFDDFDDEILEFKTRVRNKK